MKKVNVSNYLIVIPQSATISEITAAAELSCYLERITGIKLPTVTDSESEAEHEICIGYTNRSCKDMFNTDALGLEGFVIEAFGEKLFIAGGKRGVIYGVYTFLESYLGCRFYASDCENIPYLGKEIPFPEVRDEQIPRLEYREIDFVTSRKNNFQAKLKTNGRYSRITDEYGGAVIYAGGFVHTLEHLVPQSVYREAEPELFAQNPDGTRQSGWGAQLCLSNPRVLGIVKDKVREILKENPDASIVSISQSDTGNGMLPCMCDSCRRIYEEEGAFSGAVIRFVNAVADEFREEYPTVKFDTLAYRYSRNVCKTKPHDNVIVRLCTIECCFSHPIGSCKDIYAAPGITKTISEDLSDWSRICKNIYVWDYATNFKESVVPFPNFAVLRKNVRFFAEHNAVGIYEEGNYYSDTCDFPELRSYVMAKLLWDPLMSEEKYQSYIDEFLCGYYGKGWRFIRDYIDLLQETVSDKHFGIYERFSRSYFAHSVTEGDSDGLTRLSLDAIRSCEDTDWSEFIGYDKTVAESDITVKGKELLTKATELATPDEARRVGKIMLQIDFLRSHALYESLGGDNPGKSIRSLIEAFFSSTDEGRSVSLTERVTLTENAVASAKELCNRRYTEYVSKLIDTAMDYGITRLGECGPYTDRITELNSPLF